MYTVKEVAQKIDISEHTLRFWDKSGLFPFINRDLNNIRQFTQDDLAWVKLVKCLRAVGTDNKAIKQYVELCQEGDSTIPRRYEIIKATKLKAEHQMQELQIQLELLEYKEKFYEDLISNKAQDSWNPANQISNNNPQPIAI